MELNRNTKLELVRKAMAKKDWDLAIKLAARFPSLGSHGSVIRRAKDAMNNPKLYEQLGRDLKLIKKEAIAALKERFSKSWDEVKKTSQ